VKGSTRVAAVGILSVAAGWPGTRVLALDWRQPWVEPRSAALTPNTADEFAWRLFVALNWPATAATGDARGADRRAALGNEGPVVWETWATAGEIFLGDGSDPGPWRGGEPGGSGVAMESRFENLALKELSNARHVVGGVMVPLVDPPASASRLTEIRMNRKSYEFIRSAGLYNLDGQLRARAGQARIDFPAGARDVKAKWRPIRDEERSRYHSVRVVFADGSTRLFGLTALHIASKDQPHWFWATFEQVDNPLQSDNEGWRLPSRDRFGCRGSVEDCNRAPRGVGLEGTVWQYYRLRGTLTQYVDGAGRPQLLANSELETGMQTTASCMTCHSRSSIGGVAGAVSRLAVLDSSGGHLTLGESAADVPARRGYVGVPEDEWFGRREDGGAAGFWPLDFVWSLAKAQPRKTSSR
jgi:hypothetical protein